MPQMLRLFDSFLLTLPDTVQAHQDSRAEKRALFLTDKNERFVISFEEGMPMRDMLAKGNAVSYQCCKDGKYIHERRMSDAEERVAFFHMELEDDEGSTVCLSGQMRAKPDYNWADTVEPVLLQLLEGMTLREGGEGNRMKKWMGFAMCMAFLLSLFACQSPNAPRRKPGMLDGPGMINTSTWESFELSRSDSYYQYNFWFALKSSSNCYLLTGESMDEDGTAYASLDGIKVPNVEAEELRKTFALDELSDKTEDADSELIVLDAPMITLTLTYADGSQKQKSIGGDTSMDIYEALLPYFIHN